MYVVYRLTFNKMNDVYVCIISNVRKTTINCGLTHSQVVRDGLPGHLTPPSQRRTLFKTQADTLIFYI